MKKLVILLIALVAINSAMAQGCLPEGITFTTQEEIDNFQTNYPGCMEIEGDVTIIDYGNDISSLNGLNILSAIGGDLTIIWCQSLNTLSGLDNLSSIEGTLYFHHSFVTNLGWAK